MYNYFIQEITQFSTITITISFLTENSTTAPIEVNDIENNFNQTLNCNHNNNYNGEIFKTSKITTITNKYNAVTPSNNNNNKDHCV